MVSIEMNEGKSRRGRRIGLSMRELYTYVM